MATFSSDHRPRQSRERGSIADLLATAMGTDDGRALRRMHPLDWPRLEWRRLKQVNLRGRAQRAFACARSKATAVRRSASPASDADGDRVVAAVPRSIIFSAEILPPDSLWD